MEIGWPETNVVTTKLHRQPKH